MMTDPIADLLTRIRNGVRVERPFVDVPSSNVKVHICEALQREGFIWDFEVVDARSWQDSAYQPEIRSERRTRDSAYRADFKPGCRVIARYRT